MIICDKSLCTGCSVCADICPKQCIEIKYDSNGFLQSFVDEKNCINCKRCVSVCPANNPNNKNKILNAYKIRRNDPENAMSSTSGGVAAVLSEYIVENGGYVVGCEMDSNLNVKHSIADNPGKIECFKGSKYVQSKTQGVYKETKTLLEDGKTVLFVGTPCQVSALNNFLAKPYDNLYTVDLVCHGVMSQKILDRYVEWLQKKNDDEITKIKFRSKDGGYKNCSLNNWEFIGKEKSYYAPFQDGIVLWFTSGLALRCNCYRCNFVSVERCADISLADFSGEEFTDVEKSYGVSKAFVNTYKGEEILWEVSDKVFAEKGDTNVYIQSCSRLHQKNTIPAVREIFFADINELSVDEMISKYTLKRILPSRFILHLNAIKNRFKKLRGKFNE